MMKFRVSYLVSGMRVMEVNVPDDVNMPANWQEMTNEQKDEWLFSVQTNSRLLMEDLDYAEASKITAIP
jgi:hypothetical protein